MESSAGSIAESYGRTAGFSSSVSVSDRIQFLNWQRRPVIPYWQDIERGLATSLDGVVAIRASSPIGVFSSKDTSMKKFVTKKNVTALTRIAVLCALTLLSVGFSPAFAAAFSRGVDVGATFSAMRSMIGPLGAIREWLPPFASCARGSIDQIISLL